ncbi:MAG: GNAT family N-acetyltransferase [Trueperaceae bacterium]|nr:MAG: GNAT family N-acetyltransferase [Trueperaceae bacterium]
METLLETERLLLRRFRKSDADNLFELDSDPEVMRFLSGGTRTPRDVIEQDILPRFLHIDACFPTCGFFAAIEKVSGDFIGWFSFRPSDESVPREVTLGFRVHAVHLGLPETQDAGI